MFKFIAQMGFKNYYLVTIIIYFIFNIGILDNAPFSDDYYHVFNHSFLRDNNNPLLFFSPWSEYFKSWGFTYSYFWMIFAIFDKNILVCRVFNLILHYINHLLFKKYLKTKIKSPGRVNTLALLFLFSPLSVLTTAWIFQAKTLLSVLFILLFLLKLNKIKKLNLKPVLHLSIPFLLSITSKVTGILLPFYALWELKKRLKLKNAIIITTPLFTLALIYGVINIKGITYLKSELNMIAAPTININKNYIIKKTEDKKPLIGQVSRGSQLYFAPLKNTDKLIDKHIISLQNFTKLFLSTVGINQFNPFYEDNLSTVQNKNLYLLVFLAILIVFVCIKMKNPFLFPTIILFLPISGYFYVPYMKHSFTSDHWFYPASFFVLLTINEFIKRQKYMYVLIIPTLMAFILNTVQYYDFTSLIKKNYANNKNPFVLEILIQDNILHKNLAGNYFLHDYILKNEDFNNPIHYKGLLKSYKGTKDKNLYNFFGRFAIDQIKSENRESFNGFVEKHETLYEPNQIELSKLLALYFQ
jgi:hypothetical protein